MTLPDDGPHLARWQSPDDPPPWSYVLMLLGFLVVLIGLPLLSAWYFGWLPPFVY